MKNSLSLVINLSLFTSSLASHDIYKRSRSAHNRLDLPRERRTIHNKPPSYPIGTLGISHSPKRADVSLPEGWISGGCIYDSEDRVMKDYAVKSAENTPAHCISTCVARGFSYAGVEYQDECWCSNGFHDHSVIPAKSSECNMPCAGDSSVACGGSYRMLWFSRDPLAPYYGSPSPKSNLLLPEEWSPSECIQDRPEPNRALRTLSFKSATMTPARCVKECQSNGFKLAGVQDVTECWCDHEYGTTARPVQTFTQNDGECGQPCPGDHLQRCGDEMVMQIYRHKSFNSPLQTRTDSPNNEWVEGPCMIDEESSRLLSMPQSIPNLISPEACLDSCASQLFTIAGLQAGSECWCGNALNLAADEQPSKREVDQSECSTPCNGEEPAQTCGGPLRMRLFSRNGALQLYAFGFTRDGPSITSASLPLLASSPHSGQASSVDNERNDQGLLSSKPSIDVDLSNLMPEASSESVGVKKVLAHHMVGNTYPYTLDTWLSDISLAKAAGIDGFALNFGEAGQGGWQMARMNDAFTAAQMAGGFGMIFSFDMTVLPCGNQNDAATLRNYIMKWGPTPGHLTIPPAPGSALQRIVVSTFTGEYCTFGTGSVHDGWLTVVKDPEVVSRLEAAGREIAFIPSWFARIESRKGEFNGVVQGDFHWNGGWPAGNNDINWDTDAYHLQYNPGPLYMASVSPWFFTHYGADSFNKNWIYRGDDWLYASRWESLMEHRAQVDLVEIVTWNDYGESSYIGPIKGDQPNSQAWVNGYPHLGFLDMTSYYAAAYKTGVYPAISQDKVYIWSRPHPKNANVPQDHVGRPNNADWTEDYLWALVMSSGTGDFTLTSGGNSQTFAVVAGVNKFKVSNSPGPIRGTLSRLGVEVVDVNPGNAFLYTLNPPSYNFNNFMASN